MRTVTVTGDMGTFTGGQVLHSEKHIADYYRVMSNYDLPENRHTLLSDADILKIVDSIEGDTEDAEVERVGAILSGNVPADETEKPVRSVDATPNAEAVGLAHKADDDTSLNALIEEAVVVKEKSLMAPVAMFKAFRAKYGIEALNGFPVPGTTYKNGDNNPETYEGTSRRKGGVPGKADRNWINEFTDGLKYVRDSILAVLDNGKENAKALGPNRLEALESKYNARLSSARDVVRKAIGLHHQFVALDGYKTVEFEWAQDEAPKLGKDGQPVLVKGVAQTEMVDASTKSPICIMSKGNPRKDFAYLSVQQFLSLDFAKAIEDGGTYAHLLATMTREQKAPTGAGFNVTNIEECKAAFGAVTSYLLNDANIKALTIAMLEKNDETDKTLQTLDELMDMIGSIVSAHRKRLDLIADKQGMANAARQHVA